MKTVPFILLSFSWLWINLISLSALPWEMLNKAILALSADAKPGTGPGLAHANQSLACLFAVSRPWLTGIAELFSDSLVDKSANVWAQAGARQSDRPAANC
jgi:hypothetical protein